MRVDERRVAHEPVVIDVAAEMHELVDQVHRRRRRDQQPADIGRDQPAEDERGGDRHHREGHQRIGRKERHAPVVMVGETHLLLGEELVMHQRVPVVDRAERLDLRRPVHDEAVDPPFEEIGGQKGHRHDAEFPPAQLADIGEIHRQRGKSDHVDDEDMEPAIVPAGDAVAVGRPVIALPLGHGAR